MKLLFGENLSPKLPRLLADLFPGSAHVDELGLGATDDAGSGAGRRMPTRRAFYRASPPKARLGVERPGVSKVRPRHSPKTGLG
jgi:hypothetical protein